MSMTTLDGMAAHVATKLKGIERYNPENITVLERFVDMQAKEPSPDTGYDLQANLALLKLYQFNPTFFREETVAKILLKSLTALPHSDFVLCKCLLTTEQLEIPLLKSLCYLHELLETCCFKEFWVRAHALGEVVRGVAGFEDAVRRFACHVIGITYAHIQEETLCELLGLVDETTINQWIDRNGWKQGDRGYVLISKQEAQIKTKKITEKVDLESVASIMAQCF